ncbi:MAG TPA: hypothetical protein VFV52_17030 [Bacilli bacterium]|nr:hypothetical protein [Bacilli bacterium]
MAKNRNFQPDVELIPYYEYDPSIHNIEYRYIQDPSFWSNNYFNNFQFDGEASDENNAAFDSEDFRYAPYGYVPGRRRRRRRRPYYGAPFFFPVPGPFYGGGYPYGGYPYGGYYGGGYGGYDGSPSR